MGILRENSWKDKGEEAGLGLGEHICLFLDVPELEAGTKIKKMEVIG